MNEAGYPLKTDCRHFRSDRPCTPHKLRGKICPTCDEYDPSANRVLIVKLAAMGDVLRTTCILRGLRARFAAPIVWLTRPNSVDLLRHNPFIDEIWTTDEKLADRLEAEPFRAVINTDAERSSAAISAMARAKEKLGFSLDAAGNVAPLSDAARLWHCMGVNDGLKRENRRTYQQIIADIAGIPARDNEIVFALTDEERERATDFAKRALPNDRDAVVGFNTGGADRWTRKQWTFDGFAGLGRQILRETRHAIILYGGAGEEEFNGRLEKTLNDRRVVNVNTKKSVREFGAMLSLCDVLVTGDTLGLHIASALGKKHVVLFGPTSDAEIDVYGRGEKITADFPCRSYYRPTCDAEPCCIRSITAGRVFDATERLLK